MDSTVIIIGAGISGLKAAQELYANGIKDVLIFESRQRIGGRLLTTEGYNGRKYDLGASWHHDTLSNGLFLEDLQLPSDNRTPFVFDDDQLLLVDCDGDILDDNQRVLLEKLKPELDKFIENENYKSLNEKDITYFEMVMKYIFTRRMLLTDDQILNLPRFSRFLELWHGIDWKSLSAKYSSVENNGRNAMVFHYDNIVKRISSTFPQNWIHMNTKVKKVERNGTKITVTTENNDEYTTSFLIVTVPQSVLALSLKSDDHPSKIVFQPPLNQKITKSLSAMHFSSLGKVILEFDRCTWSTKYGKIMTMNRMPSNFVQQVRSYDDFEDLLSQLDKDTRVDIGHDPWSFPIYFVNLMKTCGVPSFVLLIQYPLTQHIESMSKDQICRFFLPTINSVLKSLNSPELDVDLKNEIVTSNRPILKNIITTNWTLDPFSMGSYSACHVGDDPLDAVISLNEGQGPIRFAGEHTVLDGAGCVYGAWESGKREVEYILKQLNME